MFTSGITALYNMFNNTVQPNEVNKKIFNNTHTFLNNLHI